MESFKIITLPKKTGTPLMTGVRVVPLSFQLYLTISNST